VSASRPIVVVGGGAIGVASALALREAGAEVALVERGELGAACSSGNSGLISASGIVPHAGPTLLRSLPNYLLSATGPLTVRSGALPHALPWFLQMLRFASRAQYERVAAVLAGLLAKAQPALLTLAARSGADDLIRKTGTITLHETQAAFEAAQSENALRRRHGIEVHALSRDELLSLEPALSPRLFGGSLMPANAFTIDPRGLVTRFGDCFRELGGAVIRGEVIELGRNGGGPTVTLASGRIIEAGAVVLAAGAWTGKLAHELGASLQLGPHRGYHVMAHKPGITLAHPLMWPDRGFAIVPMADGIRAAGKVEIADADAPPDPRVPQRILAEMRSAFREIDTTETSEWMGVRPATPDSLPLIGTLPGLPDVAVASGHGHLGLTLSAFTGQLVAELLLGRTPSIDLSPFAPDRFTRAGGTSLKEKAHV